MLWVLIRSASVHKNICCGYSSEAPQSIKTYVVGTHQKRLTEVLLMSTHNICFYGEIRKIIPELSSNTPPQVLWIQWDSWLKCSAIDYSMYAVHSKNPTRKNRIHLIFNWQLNSKCPKTNWTLYSILFFFFFFWLKFCFLCSYFFILKCLVEWQTM